MRTVFVRMGELIAGILQWCTWYHRCHRPRPRPRPIRMGGVQVVGDIVILYFVECADVSVLGGRPVTGYQEVWQSERQ